jgi:alternate signal-mediated exported protein
MNKLTKGAIAGAAGIALLLGGAGSFALWSDSTTVNAGTINAGTMTLDAFDNGTWTKGGVALPANFKMVPGDVLTYRAQLDIHAVGNALKAKLSLDSASALRIYDLTPQLTIRTAAGQAGDFTITATTDPLVYDVVPGANGGDVSAWVQLTVTLPVGTVGDNSNQNATFDFGTLNFSLEQYL